MPRGTRKQHPRESVARGNSLHPIVAPRIHRASGDARPAATRVYRRIARLNRLPSMTQSISEHTTASIISRTRAYVQENFLYMRPNMELSDDDPLLGRGVLDSVGVIELVEFLQAEFHITVGEDEMTEQNLGSFTAIGA